MPATLTLIMGPEFAQRTKRFVFNVAFSGSYTAGGDTVDFSPFVSGNASDLPLSVCEERLGGYAASYVPGATIAAGKLKLFTTAATELSAGAYPAGLTGLTDARLVVVLPA